MWCAVPMKPNPFARFAPLVLLFGTVALNAQTSTPAATKLDSQIAEESQPQYPPIPKSPPQIMHLADIKTGMHGVAYTVFQGTQPEGMGVEVLGVLYNANGPKTDMILVRLTGAKVEYTGVVAGMSGSPVYIDGKLVGALAFRIGSFSKDPIAGITPIEDMLEISEIDHSVPADAMKDTKNDGTTTTATKTGMIADD